MIAAAQPIRRRFDKLDQITFDINKSDSHLDEAIRLTNNSGADVQNAKIVNQITMGGIPNFLATLLLPHTNISHHRINEINHNTINNAAKTIPHCPWNIGSVILITHHARNVRKRRIIGI